MPLDRTPDPTTASLMDRRRFLRNVAATALAGSGGVLMLGCGDDSADDATATGGDGSGTGDLQAVTFLSPIPPESLTFMPELLGISAGYFADVGLDVTLQRMRGSAQALQGILSELALLSRVTDIELMLAVGERGATELVNIGTLIKDSTIRFASSSDNPVRSAEDFVGKTIGIPSEGGSSELTVDLMARSAGIDDYSTQVVGLTAGTFDLVESGRIDCYAVSLDTSVVLEQTRDAVVLKPGDSIFAGGQCYISNLTALDDDASPANDIVNGYMEAVGRSVDAILADAGNDFSNIFATVQESFDFDTLTNPEVAVPAATQLTDSWVLDGEDNTLLTTDDRWQGVYDELVAAELLADGHEPGDWFTNGYIDK